MCLWEETHEVQEKYCLQVESGNKGQCSLRLEGIFQSIEDITVQCGTAFQDGETPMPCFYLLVYPVAILAHTLRKGGWQRC
eukprot:7934601-Ditylum_brightwellii.AAC.1